MAVTIEELEILIEANVEKAVKDLDSFSDKLDRYGQQFQKAFDFSGLEKRLDSLGKTLDRPIKNAAKSAERSAQKIAQSQNTISDSAKKAGGEVKESLETAFESLDDIAARAVKKSQDALKGGFYKPQTVPLDTTRLATSLAKLKQDISGSMAEVQKQVGKTTDSLSKMDVSALDELNAKIESRTRQLAQLVIQYRQRFEQFHGQGSDLLDLKSKIQQSEAALHKMIAKSDRLAASLRDVNVAAKSVSQQTRNLSLPVPVAKTSPVPVPRIPAPVNQKDLSITVQKMDKIKASVQQIQNPKGKKSSWLDALRQKAGQIAAAMGKIQQNTDRASRSAKNYGKTAKQAANKAQSAFMKLGSIIKNVLITGMMYRAFYALFRFIRDGIQSAIAAPETENMFRVALGRMADEADVFAKRFRKSFGVDEFVTKGQLGTFMNMISTMGIGSNTAYKMSKSLTILANDMASLYNVPVEQTFQNLQSAMSGESEAVRKYGYVLNETTIKQTAYRYGIAEVGKELTEQQKVAARYYALMEQSSAAQGDLARTSNSLGNQLRVLKSNITAAGRSLGEVFLPFIQAVVPWLNAFMIVVQRVAETLARFTYSLFGMEYDKVKKEQQQISSKCARHGR